MKLWLLINCIDICNIYNSTYFLQINLREVTGTGRDGRILKEDMLRHIESLSGTKGKTPSHPQDPRQTTPCAVPSRAPVSPPQASPPSKVAAVKKPVAPVGEDRSEPIKGFKKAMVRSMNAALVITTYKI